jgi:aminopeptidase N
MEKVVRGVGKIKMPEKLDLNSDKTNSKTEIFLKDYTPPPFQIDKADLLFELNGDDAVVTAITRFYRTDLSVRSIQLDGGPYMRLLSIELDGVILSDQQYEIDAKSLLIHNVPDRFTLKIVTQLKPVENTRLEGLYKSSGNFCTQCEAEGFRHITYFLDRPDVMTKYRVRIEAAYDECPVLLSNGNPVDKGRLVDGRHYVVWEDPFPKPSYLFAMVAGNLSCLKDNFVTKSGNIVELNIYAADDDISKCHHAMQSLKNSMRWDEETFGLEYDLDVYNIVAVSDFNMGAMENKGLNIFNTKYVLASPDTATDQDYNNVEGVIGHEYFHNWTGNRVTCRDWFQLSLKEGLTVFRDQEFSGDMQSRAVKRLDDVRVLRMHQFPEDAGPLAHPVRPEKYIEINNFYSATVYNKGAEVIRMMHSIIGPEAFRRGMDVYFKRHDGQAVTCEDFVLAMEAASCVDLKQFRHWYSVAGTPKLKFVREIDGDEVLLTIEQTLGQEHSSKPFHIPIRMAWLNPENGQALVAEVKRDNSFETAPDLLHLTEKQQTFRFKGIPVNAVPSLMREFSAPVHIEHDLSTDELLSLAAFDSDSFVRSEAMQTISRDVILSPTTDMLQDVEHGRQEVIIPEGYAQTFLKLLEDDKTESAFLADLLTVPNEIDIGQHMAPFMPEVIHRRREALLDQISARYSNQILDRYHLLHNDSSTSSPKGQAERKLKNALLGYISRTVEGKDIVWSQFVTAKNMTDQIAALALLASGADGRRDDALVAFLEQWKGEALVVDKWFAVQALSKRSDVVKDVRTLMKHQHFSFVNPNRLRALISSFSILNQAGFHNVDGSGYELLADVVLKVDTINPQTAARLVAPLGQWQRLDEHRQHKIQSLLDMMLRQSTLSADVRELVEKSLN